MDPWEYDELSAKIALALKIIQEKGIMALTEQDRSLFNQISDGLNKSKEDRE